LIYFSCEEKAEFVYQGLFKKIQKFLLYTRRAKERIFYAEWDKKDSRWTFNDDNCSAKLNF
jgi:hypothetical protein